MRLEWDKDGQRAFEMGVDHGVLYPMKTNGTYDTGVAWNGLTGVTESPDGAEPTDLWADNMKYATLRSAETFGGTIEAYTYPDEFMVCDGSAVPAPGMRLGQQARRAFGLAYRTKLGSDVDPTGTNYLLHIVYNATASPSEKSYETINDSPDAITFSWEFTTTAVKITGHDEYNPISTIILDSRKVDPSVLAAIENRLYGTESANPSLPSPAEILALAGTSTTYAFTAVSSPSSTANPSVSHWYVATKDNPDTTDPDDFELSTDTEVQDGVTYYTMVATSA